MASAHVSAVRCLFKRILVLHRSLPLELQALGDEYVKAEFRRHKGAQPEEATKFMNEWKDYADTLSIQVTSSPSHNPEQKSANIGQDIDSSRLDQFNQEQLGQLYELAQETNKPYVPPDQS